MRRALLTAGLALLLAGLSADTLRAEGGFNFGFNYHRGTCLGSCTLMYNSHQCSCGCIPNPYGFDPCNFNYGTPCNAPPIYYSSPLNDWLAFGAGHPPAGVNLFPPPGYGLGLGYGTGQIYGAPAPVPPYRGGAQGYAAPPPLPQAPNPGYGGAYWRGYGAPVYAGPTGNVSAGYFSFGGSAGY